MAQGRCSRTPGRIAMMILDETLTSRIRAAVVDGQIGGAVR